MALAGLWRGRVARRGQLGLLVMVVVALVALPTLAFGATQSFDSPEECVAAKPIDVPVMDWSCTSTDGQTWSPSIQGASGPPSSFGIVITLILFWSLIPLVIACVLANQQGESMAMAVLLTVFLGWIGLAIVYFGQRKTRAAVDGLVNRAASPPGSPRVASTVEQVSAEERLRRLERLREEDLVTEEEYVEQRKRIVGSL